MANNDPKCKLTSISKELRLKLLNFEIRTKCADELTGINSVIPWTTDSIIVSNESDKIHKMIKNQKILNLVSKEVNLL